MKTTSVTIKQTKAGQDYKQFVMEDGKRLSVFQFDTRYPELEVGTDLPDDILIYDQQYDNYKLKPLPKPVTPTKGGFGGKQAEALMDKKVVNIEKSQDRKQEAILRAGAFRDATLVSLASLREQPFPTDAEYQAEWRKWVKFFVSAGEEPFI